MKFKTRHAITYMPAALLGILIVKLMLGGMFLVMKKPVLAVPVFDTRLALAEDEATAAGQEQSSKPSPEEDVAADSKTPPNSKNVGEGLEVLELKRAEIEMEKLRLKREREQLAAVKKEIEARLVRLSQVNQSIQQKLDEQMTVINKRIKHLIKIYTSMKPKKAALLIEKLDMDFIMDLFSQMKGENVGQILPYVSPDKAAKISARLAKSGK